MVPGARAAPTLGAKLCSVPCGLSTGAELGTTDPTIWALAAGKPGAVAQLPQAGAGWASWLRERIRWSPGLALACTVVAVQFGVIAQMISTRSDEIAYAEYRAIESQSRGDTFIRVIFKPVTTEAQLTQILRANSAEIVAGPSQLGEYYLLVPPKEATPTLSRMLANVQIESAEIVNALPTHP